MSNVILAKLNELRGLSNAFIMARSKYDYSWNDGFDTNLSVENMSRIIKTCNEVCDENGFIDEDAQPDVAEFSVFKRWMEGTLEYSKIDSSTLDNISLSVAITALDDNYINDVINVIMVHCDRFTVVSQDTNKMIINIEIGFNNWIRLYKLIERFYPGESIEDEDERHPLYIFSQRLADQLQIANSYFTRDIIREIPL